MRPHFEIYRPGSYRMCIVKRDNITKEVTHITHDFTSRQVALAALAIWNHMGAGRWQYRERYV